MNATSTLYVLYTTLAVMGVALLVLSTDVTDTVVGIGAAILGILGLEVRSIDESITKSREVM